MTILSSILFVLYLILNIVVSKKINNALYLSESRRSLHKVLIWIVPFLGPLMIKGFWEKKDSDLEIITKEKRKTKKGSYYESGIGTTV